MGQLEGNPVLETHKPVETDEEPMELNSRDNDGLFVGLYRLLEAEVTYVQVVDKNNKPPHVDTITVEEGTSAMDVFKSPLQFTPKSKPAETARF